MKKYFLIILTLWFAIALSSCSKPEEIREPDTDKVDPGNKPADGDNSDDSDDSSDDEAEKSCSIAVTINYITDTPQKEADKKFHFEIAGDAEGVVTIDWGDGTVEDLEYIKVYRGSSSFMYGSNFSHAYEKTGTYKVKIFEKHGSIMLFGCDRYQCNYENRYSSLKIIDCPQLEYLYCYNNRWWSELELSDNKLDVLELSGCPDLRYLYCYRNNLTSLDISGCPKLRYLDCDQNNLTSLDLSGCPKLEYVFCGGNQLTELNADKCTQLQRLYCSYNRLTSLEVSECLALLFLDCVDNRLAALDVRSNLALTYLSCSDNRLTALDVRENAELSSLVCFRNQLTTLDVSKNLKLNTLYCQSNQLAELDVSKCTLFELRCENNKLTSLNVAGCEDIRELYCQENQLTSLDISGCSSLGIYSYRKALVCYHNKLSESAMENIYNDLPECHGSIVVDKSTAGDYTIARDKGWTVELYE